MEHPVTHPSLPSRAFPEGGIYIMRSERIYLLAVCHQIGVNGKGPHKHNDWLSFELCVDGKPVIIDPGTYCYTGNAEMRFLFRSTASHNTVVIDNDEQISFRDSMFTLANPFGETNVISWVSADEHDILEAEHTGYHRLLQPVTHRRRFFLNKYNNEVEITDSFLGKGIHTLEWYLHLEPGLKCRLTNKSSHIYRDEMPVVTINCPVSGATSQVQRGWVSKAYNRREEGEVIYSRNMETNISPHYFTWRLSIPDMNFRCASL